MKPKTKKILFWTPRVLAILITALISLLALDVFSEGYSFGETLVALFMHLIPTFILVAAIIVAWKWPKIGGAIWIGLGIFYILMTRGRAELVTLLILAGVPIVIGVLFWISDNMKGKNNISTTSTPLLSKEGKKNNEKQQRFNSKIEN